MHAGLKISLLESPMISLSFLGHWQFLEKHKLGQRATQMKEWQRQKCSSLSGFQKPIDLVPSLVKEAKI